MFAIWLVVTFLFSVPLILVYLKSLYQEHETKIPEKETFEQEVKRVQKKYNKLKEQYNKTGNRSFRAEQEELVKQFYVKHVGDTKYRNLEHLQLCFRINSVEKKDIEHLIRWVRYAEENMRRHDERMKAHNARYEEFIRQQRRNNNPPPKQNSGKIKISAWEILELERGASVEEIKSAYKRFALKYHPDKNKSKEAELKMRLLNDARNLLLKGT